MTEREKELIDQILEKLKSIDSNLSECRNEMTKDMKNFSSETMAQFKELNIRLDRIIAKREEEKEGISNSLQRILKNLERSF